MARAAGEERLTMLVLDANILIRGVLGGSRSVVELPAILARRGVAVPPAMAILDQLKGLDESVDAERYRSFEVLSRQRIARRDEDDWPVLACALALDCPIWTEDTDFFGCGVATWTTDREQ